MLVVAAVFLALDLWFYHRSIQYIGPGLSTLLANFQVFVMAAAGYLILREPPSTKQLVAIPLALLGLALIVGLDWGAVIGGLSAGHNLRLVRRSDLRVLPAQHAPLATGVDESRPHP